MSNFIHENEEEVKGKINIDDLYEKEQRTDLKQLSIFNKLLNRVHKRIQTTSRSRTKDKYIWYQVPEYIFGEPVYDQGECIGYLVVKLEENGFHVRYIHPNTIFVSWEKWIPSYVRNEVKKKTGKVIDEKGNIVRDLRAEEAEAQVEESDPNAELLNRTNANTAKNGKQYTPIDEYKPTGNLVYKADMFEKLDKRFNNNGR
jgi:hypothetical protein